MDARTRLILLAEDDRFLRKAADTALRRHGFSVVTATNGEEALEALRTMKPDLILLDLIMPKVQGFEVLRSVKENPATAHIPVIVLSNLGQEGDVKRAMESGATAYFVKANLTLEEMVTQVESVLAAHPA
jgi:CheY-like chemotaxis protein